MDLKTIKLLKDISVSHVCVGEVRGKDVEVMLHSIRGCKSQVNSYPRIKTIN